jgi:hypothetical protein
MLPGDDRNGCASVLRGVDAVVEAAIILLAPVLRGRRWRLWRVGPDELPSESQDFSGKPDDGGDEPNHTVSPSHLLWRVSSRPGISATRASNGYALAGNLSSRFTRRFPDCRLGRLSYPKEGR